MRSHPFGLPWRNARCWGEPPAPATEPRRAGQNSRAKAVLTLWIAYDCSPAAGKSQTKRVPHHATPAFNVSSAAEIHRFASSTSTMAWQRSRRTPAHEILAAQFVQRRHECWLPHDPCAVFRDHLVARAVATNHERIAPFAGATDVKAIRRWALADLSGIENLAHGHLPSPS